MKNSNLPDATVVNGIPEVSVESLHLYLLKSGNKDSLQLIDVRRPEEFNNELGHIQGAKLITLGPVLNQFLKENQKSEKIIFICRSGVRSAEATSESLKLGYTFVFNMSGGMMRWNDKKLPIVRD